MYSENIMRWKKKSQMLKMLWNILYQKIVEMYCVNCKKNTANKNYSVRRTKQNRLILVSNCAVCTEKKSRLIKNEEVSRSELH